MRMPSVTTRILVAGPATDSCRTLWPIVAPGLSPRVAAMRRAAIRAASRRGSSITMERPASQGSSSSAGGTRVVLPAPGGA